MRGEEELNISENVIKGGIYTEEILYNKYRKNKMIIQMMLNEGKRAL